MSTKARMQRHGANHSPGGSDPIPRASGDTCNESSLGAYEGNPTDCQVAPGGGLHPRMVESLGPIRYVDTVGGDDNDDGLTTATAWQTVANVGTEDFHGMQPGWIIRVKGTLDDSNTEDFNVDDCPSGTFAQPITFEPWPGETAPKFSNLYVYGGGNVAPHALGEGWQCYFRFRGFTADVADSAGNGTYGGFIEFDGCQFNGVYHTIYGNDNTLIGCTFTDSVLQAYTQQSGVGHSQAHRLSVLNCLLDGNLGPFDLPQIQLVSDVTMAVETLLEDVIVANNTLVNMQDASAPSMVEVAGATGLRIVNNIFAHCVNEAISSTGTHGGTGNVAVRNLYFDVDAEIVVAGGASPITDGGANVTSDPLFVTDPGDYSLQASSPAIEAADPWWVPAADITGANRPNTVPRNGVDVVDEVGIDFDQANAGGYLDVASDDVDGDGYGQHYSDTGGGGIVVESTAQVLIAADGGSVTVKSGDSNVYIDASAVWVNLGPGVPLQVRDSGTNTIFEVREDGSVHILTGTSIIADL